MRVEFRKNYSAVLSEKLRVGSGVLNEEEMYDVYNSVKDFGGDKDVENLHTFNGLTIDEITQRGRDIREQKLTTTIHFLTEETASLKKQVARDKKFAHNYSQVKVTSNRAHAVEGFNMEIFNSIKKSWGTIGSFIIFVTVQNNSSESVKKIDATITILDKDGNKSIAPSLANLLPVDNDDLASTSDLQIAPGAEWRGKFIWKLDTPNQKFPFPPASEHKVILSNIKPEFAVDAKLSSASMAKRAERFERSSKYLDTLKQELASIQ